MDGHQRDLLAGVVVFVFRRQQQHLLQEEVECLERRSILLGLFFVHFARGDFVVVVAEFLNTVEEFLDIFYSVGVLGVVVLTQRFYQTRGQHHLVSQRVGVGGELHGREHLYHGGKVGDTLLRRAVDGKTKRGEVLYHGKDRDIVVGSSQAYLVHRGIADTTCRLVDDSNQTLVVVVVDHQTKVAEHILHLLTSIERNAAVYPIGNIAMPHGILDGSTLAVVAIEDSEMGEGMVLVAQMGIQYLVGNHPSLVAFVGGTQQPNGTTRGVVCPDGLFYLLFVF